jgi:hypothetical protein
MYVTSEHWKSPDWTEGQPLQSGMMTGIFDHDTLRGLEILRSLTAGPRWGEKQCHNAHI